ncbi:MAG: hypothetical protein E6K80_10450 [Candidatus Eisenbacteria bacterium]|uniref:Uncharacterized protein n=1 Tax=Eiseniibacteriota bacterium TaxID=2212470 RepID=A0A538U1Z7_UNCEI|nr:MAG: hypothetical protein E6K80_10450 [Candidatus Eisenbacteria bacterium]
MSLLLLLAVPLAGVVAVSCDPRRARRLVWLALAALAHLVLLGFAWGGRLRDSRVLWLCSAGCRAAVVPTKRACSASSRRPRRCA